jgi:hypothetical protein
VIDFKGSHFERDIVLWGVRWYVAYPISYRQLEEMMEERGVELSVSPAGRSAHWGRVGGGKNFHASAVSKKLCDKQLRFTAFQLRQTEATPAMCGDLALCFDELR